VTYHLKPSVNPLVYTVVLKFSAPQDGKYTSQIWNLVQMYASRNDAVPEGVESSATEMKISIGMKRRLGPPKKNEPWA
jgi:hypothetical protein